jgi:hypothetical protein
VPRGVVPRIARAFLAEGARVVLVDVDGAEPLADELGARGVTADLPTSGGATRRASW